MRLHQRVFSVKQDRRCDLVGLREAEFVKTHSGFPAVEDPKVEKSLPITTNKA